MEKRIAPSEQKAQALRALLEGQTEGQNGEESAYPPRSGWLAGLGRLKDG
jgi:hypothetical protein